VDNTPIKHFNNFTMKKSIFILALVSISIFGFAQSPPSVVINIDNGMTYIRIQTVSEYLSLGGGLIIDENTNEIAEAARSKHSVSSLSCKKGRGCCWKSKMMDDNGSDILGALTIVAQEGDDGTYTPEISNLYAFYNAELDEIIFR
jgi:hypothetical protein